MKWKRVKTIRITSPFSGFIHNEFLISQGFLFLEFMLSTTDSQYLHTKFYINDGVIHIIIACSVHFC